jgi:hypothetical protein
MSQVRLSYFTTNCIFYTDFEKFAKKIVNKIRPLRKKQLNADGQADRSIKKMKLTVAYHYFADNLYNSLKI